jgi:HPt (histidine-containing phosphotransfer) domain-containing protein
MMMAIWERNLPLMRGRLEILDSAAAAAGSRTLSAEQRAEAASTAHKLAGSLGMYGYADGTDIARRIEQDLTTIGPVEAADLRMLTNALRATLGL